MKLKGRFLLRLGLMVLVFAGAGQKGTAQAPPNLLFITSDDHRWDALGAAGNPAIHTPNLDRLAKEGVYFRQATVPVSQCFPIRATLLTGQAAHQHGAYAHQYHRPDAANPDSFSDRPTTPSLLREAGYQTVLVGKWHLPSDPWRVGFGDVRLWLPSGGDAFKEPRLCQGQSRDRRPVPGFTQEIFANAAIDFLRSDLAKTKPFLLWLAFTAPHVPYGPNPRRIEQLYSKVKPEDLLPPGFPRDIPTQDWRLYSEAVSHLDEQVGLVLGALAAAGLAETTVVVFLGDNGTMMGERGVGAKGPAGKVVPYESSIRVPLIVRAPGLQGIDGASDLPISALDLPPTLLSIAGVPTPSSWAGRNALPALRQREVAGFDDVFSEWADDQSEPFGHLAHRLVRTRTHKLIVWKDAARKPEIYAFSTDPRESENLAGRAESRTIEDDLYRRLRGWLQRTSDPALEWPWFATSPANENRPASPASESE